MFLLKKLLSRPFFPVPLCLEILVLGLILLCFTKKQKIGKAVVALGVALLAVMGTNFFPDRALLPLEGRNPPLSLSSGYGDAVDWVVVLSGGFKTDPQLPPRLRCEDSTLFRLVEGIAQHRQHEGSKLLLSGGGQHEVSAAGIMAETAKSLGVEESDLVLETRSQDTADQAELVRDRVGKQPFLLVTSASHMPRALKLFRQKGLNPVPAPTRFMSEARDEKVLWDYYPSHQDLAKAQRAVYEYMGLTWLGIKSLLGGWSRVTPQPEDEQPGTGEEQGS